MTPLVPVLALLPLVRAGFYLPFPGFVWLSVHSVFKHLLKHWRSTEPLIPLKLDFIRSMEWYLRIPWLC